jgi:hypothetical protein
LYFLAELIELCVAAKYRKICKNNHTPAKNIILGIRFCIEVFGEYLKKMIPEINDSK